MAARGYLSRRSKKANNPAHKSGKALRKKKIPPWDNTISNLLVYRPTKEELRRRHELHQPVHRSLDSHDTSEHSGSKSGAFRTPEPSRDKHLSVLRELMDSNEKLQEALTYSDKRNSAVKDLFGDDPKKRRGFPNITCAPTNKLSEFERIPIVAFMKEPSLGATNLDILSDTVMDDTALNDAPDAKDGDGNNNVAGHASPETTDMVELSKNSEHLPVNQPSSSSVTQPPVVTTVETSSSHSHHDIRTSRTFSTQSTVLARAPDIQKHDPLPTSVKEKRAVPISDKKLPLGTNPDNKKTSQRARTSAASSNKGLQDIRQMIDNLEDEIRKYEKETGKDEVFPLTNTKERDSCGGFTVSILNAVTKLIGYLRECENQRKDDLSVKEEIFLGFHQQQTLIDALTNDIIYMQEENKHLRHELETSRKATDEQIKFLKRELYAVLKSREYQTLSDDINFLYDSSSLNKADPDPSSRNGQAVLADVIEDHGRRDNFQYLSDSHMVKERLGADFENQSQNTELGKKEKATGRQQHSSQTLFPTGGIDTDISYDNGETKETQLQYGIPLSSQPIVTTASKLGSFEKQGIGHHHVVKISETNISGSNHSLKTPTSSFECLTSSVPDERVTSVSQTNIRRTDTLPLQIRTLLTKNENNHVQITQSQQHDSLPLSNGGFINAHPYIVKEKSDAVNKETHIQEPESVQSNHAQMTESQKHDSPTLSNESIVSVQPYANVKETSTAVSTGSNTKDIRTVRHGRILQMDDLNYDHVSVSSNTPLDTSGIFTYSNPDSLNDVRNEALTRLTPPVQNTAKGDEIIALRSSVFLGRNQSMSPNRYSSGDTAVNVQRTKLGTSPSIVASVAADTGPTKEDECIDELSKLALKHGSQSDVDIRTHGALLDDASVRDGACSSNQLQSSAISPLSYDRAYQELKSGAGKVVVTLPSMWQDANSQAQADSVRGKFSGPAMSILKPAKQGTVSATFYYFSVTPDDCVRQWNSTRFALPASQFETSKTCHSFLTGDAVRRALLGNGCDGTCMKTDKGWFALSSHVASS